MNIKNKYKKTTKALWDIQFNNFDNSDDIKRNRIIDFSGYVIDKSAYGDRNSVFSYSIDHINPIANTGNNKLNNLQLTSISTNEQKADLLENIIIHEYEEIKVQTHFKVVENR